MTAPGESISIRCIFGGNLELSRIDTNSTASCRDSIRHAPSCRPIRGDGRNSWEEQETHPEAGADTQRQDDGVVFSSQTGHHESKGNKKGPDQQEVAKVALVIQRPGEYSDFDEKEGLYGSYP